MSGVWRRVCVYWGVVEDPELEADWQSGRPDLTTRALGLAIGAAALVGATTLIVLALRFVLGTDGNLAGAVSGGLALIWTVAVLGALAVGIARWIRWLRDRRTP